MLKINERYSSLVFGYNVDQLDSLDQTSSPLLDNNLRELKPQTILKQQKAQWQATDIPISRSTKHD